MDNSVTNVAGRPQRVVRNFSLNLKEVSVKRLHWSHGRSPRLQHA